MEEYSYLDLGYSNLLSRNVVSDLYKDSGSSYNGTTNLVTSSVSTSDIESGEYSEHLIIAKDGYIRGGATDYNEGTGFWIGHYLSTKTYNFFLGNASGDKVTWDGTTLSIVGSLSVGSDVGGWIITADTLYSLSSGTPTASPNNGIVIDSSNPVITVYEGTAKRIELGYLSAAVYGLKGYATDGSTVLFELSDTQNIIGGWTLGATSLTGGNATLSSTGVLTLGTSNDVVIASSADATYRLWVGHATAASAPFNITKAGALTATSATITGVINANTGYIGGATGWVITSENIKDAAGVVGMSSTVTGSDDIRFWAGDSTPANAEFRIYESGALFASSATISGAITATTGAIGGWTINSTSIYTGTEDHSGYTTNAGDITIYSSGSVSSIHAKNFYIDTSGVLNCTSAVISGGITTTAGSSLDGQYLASSSVASASVNLALRGWTQTSVFSVTDADTISWGSGTFTASDGTAYSINASNTGNMAAKTYIYLDIGVSTTDYQITTTASTAVGNGKVLVAIAQNGTGEATFMLLNNNSYNIDAANIVASSITTNEIAANTITGTNIASLNISTKTATIDTGTVGGWTLSSSTFTTTNGGNTVTLSTGVNAFIAGPTGSPTVTISQAGVLTATGVSVSGAITGTSGAIGGWTINSTSITDAAGVVGMSSAVTGSDDVRFWAGDATPSSAEFRVTESGALTASSATITGNITATTLSVSGTVTFGSITTASYIELLSGDMNSSKPSFAFKNNDLTNAKTGTATITHYGGYSILAVLTNSDDNILYLDLGGDGGLSSSGGANPGTYEVDWAFSTEIISKLALGATTNQDAFFGFINDNNSADTAPGAPANSTATFNHIAWMVEDNTLYASCANGVTQTKSTSITATLTNYNVFRIVFTPGVSAVFYLNGTAVATLTTNLPTATSGGGSRQAIKYAITNVDGGGGNDDKAMYIFNNTVIKQQI